MEPFKNRFNPLSINELSESIKEVYKSFDVSAFNIYSCQNLDDLEMKERAVQISFALEVNLGKTKKQNEKILKVFIKKTKLSGFILWPISIYIERIFIDDFKIGMDLLTELTKKFTSEFGIRPFFEKYPDETYAFLKSLINDDDEHVRRWISEGIRPNLPWGMNISHLHEYLEKSILLIEPLASDSSLYVRRSVANHMSDISMINPRLALKYLEKWHLAHSEYQVWIVKKALRNLIKKGNKKALAILGYSQAFKASVESLSIIPKRFNDGSQTRLNISINSQKKQNLMIDYVIGYPKKNGTISKKVFKLKVVSAQKGE
jgi:3-methyladenine DNA glycosylase AlkC